MNKALKKTYVYMLKYDSLVMSNDWDINGWERVIHISPETTYRHKYNAHNMSIRIPYPWLRP